MRLMLTFLKKSVLSIVIAAFIAAAAPFSVAYAGEAADPRMTMIADVLSRIEAATGFSPRVTLSDDASMSAFVMPDGTVVLSAGLVSATMTDDEMAFIIAHEASHILAGDQSPALADSDSPLLREMEADASALDIMERAGFDPGASVDILLRLSGRAEIKSRILAISRLLGLN